MTRQDFDTWKEDESRVGYDAADFSSCERRRGFLSGADATFNLLSKERDEVVDNLRRDLAYWNLEAVAKEQEIEKLKRLITELTRLQFKDNQL